MNQAAKLRDMANGTPNLARIPPTKLKQMAGGMIPASVVQEELKRRGLIVKTAAKVARDKAKESNDTKNKIMIAAALTGGVALIYYMRKRNRK